MNLPSVRERLKEVLRQYELRERHFECVIRSKELEVLLSRARAAEQKQLASGEKTRADKQEEEVRCFLGRLVLACNIRCLRFNNSGRTWKILRTDRLCSSTSSYSVVKRLACFLAHFIYSLTLTFRYETESRTLNALNASLHPCAMN